jgi:hypothetical protein
MRTPDRWGSGRGETLTRGAHGTAARRGHGVLWPPDLESTTLVIRAPRPSDQVWTAKIGRLGVQQLQPARGSRAR